MSGRLTRSRDAMVGGVAGGVARWINADPALVRIAWTLLVPLTGGVALLAYIVAWVVVPEEAGDGPAPASTDEAAAERAATTQSDRRRDDDGRIPLLIGGGLVLIGLWFLVREYLPNIDWDFIWPIVVIGVGAIILVGAARRR